MQFVNLGPTGVKVSRLCLGCMTYGSKKWREWVLDEGESRPFIRRALDAGINFFDTADIYGGTRSEELLGRALGRHRDEVVVATKFAAPVDDDPRHAGASARWVREAVDGSLRRLGTDRIDLYQQHMPDPAVPIDETLAALDALVRAGKVREIGNSNFSADQIDEAARVSAEHGFAKFLSAQNELNMLRRKPLEDVIPAEVFKAEVRAWAERIGVQLHEVQIRPMKRKWASCSSKGRLTFDTDLLRQPAGFRAEVIVHELLHLKVPNHGKLFKAPLRAYLTSV